MSTIITPRLDLVPFSGEHLTDRYVAWLNDPEVVRYSERRGRVHTRASCAAYVSSFAGTPNALWAILTRGDGLHVGNVSAHVEPAHGLADVGILLGAREAWGRGLGTEAWLGVCDHLLRLRGLRKVTAGTLSVNAPMLAVMEKAGMVLDGRRSRHYLWNDREVDVVHAALFRDRWLERHPDGPFSRGGESPDTRDD